MSTPTPKLSVLRHLLTRGPRLFIALGAIYVRSSTESAKVTNQLRETLDGSPPCTAFVRWGYGNRGKTANSVNRAILISGVGRFGNSVIQILNSFAIAQSLKAQTVFYHQFRSLPERPVEIARKIYLQRIRMRPNPMEKPPGTLYVTDAIRGPNPMIDPQSAVATEIGKNLGPLLIGKESTTQGDSSLLTIHLRSGDIFWPGPHRSYGQPPFAFYQRVLENRPWSSVDLISEDSTNPCHQLIQSWCRDNSIPIRSLGSSFAESVNSLASASNLCLSLGTFVPAVVFLSHPKNSLFTFGPIFSPLLAGKSHHHFKVLDAQGTYTQEILSDNWANTHEQRELMVNYPMSALTLEEIPYAD